MKGSKVMEKLESLVSDSIIGLESEYLRLTPQGKLSTEPHPFPLNHRNFHKDFSESQLELVTPPMKSIEEVLAFNQNLYSQAVQRLTELDETLWPFSIPPQSALEDPVPLAQFPENSEAQLYRKGLLNRYGAARQLISGIHVNLSMGPRLEAFLTSKYQSNRSELYLKASRYILEKLDMLILLTGASPWGLNSQQKQPQLSFRNSRRGYPQQGGFMNFDSLQGYLEGIERGLMDINPEFQRMGLYSKGNEIQRSTRYFQSEKEFYSPIRLKQIPKGSETQLQALKKEGAAYLELRFLDKDPHIPGGIGQNSLALLQLVFLRGLLTEESRDYSWQEGYSRAKDLSEKTIHEIQQDDSLSRRTLAFLDELNPLALIMDSQRKSSLFTDSLREYKEVAEGERPLLTERVQRFYGDMEQQIKEEIYDYAV